MKRYFSSTLPLSIRGQSWSVNIATPESAEEYFDENTLAITMPRKKLMVFRPEYIDITVVRHELFHAYCTGLFTSSAEISALQFEELVAEMMGDLLPDFVKQANEVYRWLRKNA